MSYFFCFKQKTAYEMRISDWSSDVCSSDLRSRSRGSAKGNKAWLRIQSCCPDASKMRHSRRQRIASHPQSVAWNPRRLAGVPGDDGVGRRVLQPERAGVDAAMRAARDVVAGPWIAADSRRHSGGGKRSARMVRHERR